MSWKLFILIVGGILTIAGTIIGIGTPIAADGVKSMISTSKQTLDAIHSVNEKVVMIETRQAAILTRLDNRDNRRTTRHE